MTEWKELQLRILFYSEDAVQVDHEDYGDFWIPKACINECPTDDDWDEYMEDDKYHPLEVLTVFLSENHAELLK